MRPNCHEFGYNRRMSAPSAIILVIDRLGAGYLGPYGNTWLETPAFNRLASRSLLCEHVLTASPELAVTYRDYWGVAAREQVSLLQLAQRAGYRSVLVTDESDLKDFAGAEDFDELHFVRSGDAPNAPADEVEYTAIAALVNIALSQLANWQAATQPQLMWIHAGALNRVWDAPYELRDQFSDEEDPSPAPIVQPPELRLKPNYDPDELLTLSHAYAGQISLVDWALNSLLTAIDELPQRENLLLAVTAPRGYPLGEHGCVGRCDDALYSELLQVPLLMQFPQLEGALRRTQELIQPSDLRATLVDALRLDPAGSDQSVSLLRFVRHEVKRTRQLALATAPNQRVIRSTAWQLRATTGEGKEEQHELFTKPDDRWEFNDVASRCGDIVELLKQAAAAENTVLPPELTSPWR